MRVLVIDDEKCLADTLVLILRSAHHEAVAAYDSAGALSRIERFAPDVVISDILLLGMDGIEICTSIQNAYPKCHILLFSGQELTSELIGNVRDKRPSWELLAKPVDPKELLAKLALLQSVPRSPPA